MNMVVDNLEFDVSKAYDLVVGQLEGWLETAIGMLPNLVLAILTLIVFFVVGKMVRKAVNRLLHKVSDNKTSSDRLETIVRVWTSGLGSSAVLSLLSRH